MEKQTHLKLVEIEFKESTDREIATFVLNTMQSNELSDKAELIMYLSRKFRIPETKAFQIIEKLKFECMIFEPRNGWIKKL